ncbi:MAG: SDR family oxidoreductase [Actinomycetia bacterium]|nr:SDR family oxidoreductase [Actinomycetes bacterium]MCP4958258.1 SDR family oxidoreductase [Actinomycetes bacterium]
MDFNGKIAVITGAGSGMGRDMALLLASAGCHLALADIDAASVEATAKQCRSIDGELTVTAHTCDVSDETSVLGWRDDVIGEHATDHVNLVFNNAGIGGGGSFIEHPREDWDRTFGVCWFGVYYCSRAFVPLLVASEEGHLINTSSVNGFWASLGASRPHTAYSAAKFAVKGFTEALISDFAKNAPHVKASVVMPGHIGTAITHNSTKVLGHAISDDVHALSNYFVDHAPTTSEEAARIILDGVQSRHWRILVGEDAETLDEMVRAAPEDAYEAGFLVQVFEAGAMGNLLADPRNPQP